MDSQFNADAIPLNFVIAGHVDDLLPYFLEYAREQNPLVGPVLELSLTSNLSRPTNWWDIHNN